MEDKILLFDNNIVHTSDIVEIEEKKITFSIAHTEKNPEPKPTRGFWAKLFYFDTITTYTDEAFTCIVLKVKGGVQMRGKTDEYGNTTMHANQLYDFYAIYNDSKLIQLVQKDIERGNTDKVCAMGNYYRYFEMLRYPNYLTTNTLFDSTIKNKADFIAKYM